MSRTTFQKSVVQTGGQGPFYIYETDLPPPNDDFSEIIIHKRAGASYAIRESAKKQKEHKRQQLAIKYNDWWGTNIRF